MVSGFRVLGFGLRIEGLELFLLSFEVRELGFSVCGLARLETLETYTSPPASVEPIVAPNRNFLNHRVSTRSS
jgi:hypothetical protein